MNENFDAELTRRLREILSGKATAEPANKVISELRKKYSSRKVPKISSKAKFSK
ncbi:MAG TPA: hypothetical protein VK203_09825 [Nostocaceae cyanobacterium]|nr:hypothetical protein [Nostocaceae cyanobacterium]